MGKFGEAGNGNLETSPAAPTSVLVDVLREYPRDGVTHIVGSRIRIPAYALKDAEGANPPFVRRVGAAPESATAPNAGAPRKE